MDARSHRRRVLFWIGVHLLGITISATLAVLVHFGIIVDHRWGLTPRMAYWGTGMLVMNFLVFLGHQYGQRPNERINF